MQMHMPGMGGEHGLPFPFRHHPMRMVCMACFGLFWMGAVTCALGAANRAASALKLEARLKALDRIPDAFTEEERIELIHKVTTGALNCW